MAARTNLMATLQKRLSGSQTGKDAAQWDVFIWARVFTEDTFRELKLGWPT
jgi:hypothetical protein